MISHIFTIFLLYAIGIVSGSGNNHPIVLVHGLGGWGRGELFGVKYWGVLHGDFQEKLKEDGHEVFTAKVGPLSSNWDRACELYAQIKGGRTDYGAAHSSKHGHSRYGPEYPGFFPEWGQLDANGQRKKVHLIGHSMGGQTIRLLAHLLEHGTNGAPVDESGDNLLFEGGRGDWVHSVTVISSPIEGSTFADFLSPVGDAVESVIGFVINVVGLIGDPFDAIWDMQLDHWGITPRKQGESFKDYLHRVFSSPLFNPGFEDISLFDLSVKGSKYNSEWIKTNPHVYYYSFATLDTYKGYSWFKEVQKPNLLMVLPLKPISKYMGSQEGTIKKGLGYEWQPNDGIVNVVTMHGPFKDNIVSYNGQSMPGRWHTMPILNRMDHLSVVGFTILDILYPMYKNHARLIQALPNFNDSERKLTRGVVDDKDSFENLKGDIESISKAAEYLSQDGKFVELCENTSNNLIRAYCTETLKNSKNLRA